MRTNGYRLAAAYAKSANVRESFGAAFGLALPFAQRGAPYSVTSGSMPRACNPLSTSSAAFQWYAGSFDARARSGRVGATWSQ